MTPYQKSKGNNTMKQLVLLSSSKYLGQMDIHMQKKNHLDIDPSFNKKLTLRTAELKKLKPLEE